MVLAVFGKYDYFVLYAPVYYYQKKHRVYDYTHLDNFFSNFFNKIATTGFIGIHHMVNEYSELERIIDSIHDFSGESKNKFSLRTLVFKQRGEIED